MLVDIPEWENKASSGTVILIYNRNIEIQNPELRFDADGMADVIWLGAPEDAPDIQKSLTQEVPAVSLQGAADENLSFGKTYPCWKGYYHKTHPFQGDEVHTTWTE